MCIYIYIYIHILLLVLSRVWPEREAEARQACMLQDISCNVYYIRVCSILVCIYNITHIYIYIYIYNTFKPYIYIYIHIYTYYNVLSSIIALYYVYLLGLGTPFGDHPLNLERYRED